MINVVALVVFAAFMFFGGYRLLGIVVVPDDKLGIISKSFVLFGSDKSLPDGKIIALKGEAGYQAKTLAPGLYFGYWPWQYSITLADFTIVPQGKVGVVEAKDGNPIPMGRVLAAHVDCDMFQDAEKFLASTPARFTVAFDTTGKVLWDSGNQLEHLAMAWGALQAKAGMGAIANLLLVGGANAARSNDIEVEIDADHHLHFDNVVKAIGACTGRLDRKRSYPHCRPA